MEPGASLRVFWVGPLSRHEGVFSFACQIKLSCNTDPSVTSNFCCVETKPGKLHTLPTAMVLFLGFNVTETTLAQPLRGRSQAQQKSNSAKAPLLQWKLNEKKPSAVEVTRSPVC